MQEVSTAALPSATGSVQMVVEDHIPETANASETTIRRDPQMQLQLQPAKPRAPKPVVPKKPLKKQATISVKDEETAAIKAGMDLALGIAGKEHKKYVRPNKVRECCKTNIFLTSKIFKYVLICANMTT